MHEVTTGESLEKGGYFVGYNLVVRNVMSVYDLSPGSFSCLMMLFSYAGADKDKCFPGQNKLAEDLNTSIRTVIRYLGELEEKNVIITYNRFNKQNRKTKNIYDLSPCLDKIRELYAPKEKEDFILVRKEKHKNGGDRFVTTNKSTSRKIEPKKTAENIDSMEVTDLSLPKDLRCQECHPTNNNIQITNKKDDDDIPNASLSDEIIQHNSNDKSEEQQELHTPTLSDDDLLWIANMVSDIYKGKIQKRSFDSVLKKCVNNYKKGTVPNFENYLITAIENKIQDLEVRRDREKSLLDILPKVKHKKKTVRTELAPDWLKEDKSSTTEDNGQASEDERKRLEEMLKKYKKD
ncbi:helix-turn-helix domain-containing protein [Bacillus thuringiensis]